METKWEDYIDTTPDTQYYGPRKTVITNFRTLCTNLNRPGDHIRDFLMGKIGAPSCITEDGVLIIRGRHDSNKIYNLIVQYKDQYVKCKKCLSYNTKFIKEGRLTSFTCSMCGRVGIVPLISGYKTYKKNVIDM